MGDTNDEEIAKKVDRKVFPGTQGGPLMHVIGAKAVAFGEALKPEFKSYCEQVVKNAQALAAGLVSRRRHAVAPQSGIGAATPHASACRAATT